MPLLVQVPTTVSAVNTAPMVQMDPTVPAAAPMGGPDPRQLMQWMNKILIDGKHNVQQYSQIRSTPMSQMSNNAYNYRDNQSADHYRYEMQ